MKPASILGLAFTLTACGGATPAPTATPTREAHVEGANDVATTPIEAALRAIAGGHASEDFEVVYDDMHALYGGETLTLRGDGTLHALRQIPPTAPRTESTTTLSAEQVQAIAALLVELHAWRQDEPERTVPPDTSFSHLRIRIGTETSDVWELHDQMERLNQVRGALHDHMPGLAR